jgi:hypothetical protein
VVNCINSTDGVIDEWSQQFNSDYDINDRQIVFAAFDATNNTSVELFRFTIFDDNQEECPIIECMKAGNFVAIVEHLLENECIQETVH